jgi:hypothetical protein
MVGHGDPRCPNRPGGVSYLRRLPTSEISSGGFGGYRSHFGAPVMGTCIHAPVRGAELGLSTVPMTSGYPACLFFLLEQL